MNKASLSDVLELVIDYRGKTPKKLGGEWKDEGYRALSALNVKTSGLGNVDSIRFVDQNLYKKWMKLEVARGDILLTSEAPAGQVMYWDSDEKIVLSQRLFALRTDTKINSLYLKYFLQSDQGQRSIFNKLSGSTVAGISAKMFDIINIFYPERKEQDKIAALLYLIDNKISLNYKINEELQSIAQLLYNQWFLQFDFPNENGHPYKTSGGRLTDWAKPQLKIPSGWSIGNILEVATLQGGGTPSKSHGEYWNGNISFFTPSDAQDDIYCTATESYITAAGVRNSSTRIFETGTVFVTARGSVGNIMVAGEQMAMNQSCYAFIPKKGVSTPFIYFSVRNMVDYLKAKSSGSTFNSIVTNDIKFTPLVVPPVALVNQFDEIVEPVFKHIRAVSYENRELVSLRDWLLPMLMTGQIKVS